MGEMTMVERVAAAISPGIRQFENCVGYPTALKHAYSIQYAHAALEASGHAEMVEALNEARLQIEYLHEKFAETGSGNTVLAKVRSALAKATGGEG